MSTKEKSSGKLFLWVANFATPFHTVVTLVQIVWNHAVHRLKFVV